MENYLDEFKKAVKNTNLDIDFDKVDPNKDLSLQGLDSMDNVNMLFAIEDYFHISIPDAALLSGKLNTLNNILEYISNVSPNNTKRGV